MMSECRGIYQLEKRRLYVRIEDCVEEVNSRYQDTPITDGKNVVCGNVQRI